MDDKKKEQGALSDDALEDAAGGFGMWVPYEPGPNEEGGGFVWKELDGKPVKMKKKSSNPLGVNIPLENKID